MKLYIHFFAPIDPLLYYIQNIISSEHIYHVINTKLMFIIYKVLLYSTIPLILICRNKKHILGSRNSFVHIKIFSLKCLMNVFNSYIFYNLKQFCEYDNFLIILYHKWYSIRFYHIIDTFLYKRIQSRYSRNSSWILEMINSYVSSHKWSSIEFETLCP